MIIPVASPRTSLSPLSVPMVGDAQGLFPWWQPPGCCRAPTAAPSLSCCFPQAPGSHSFALNISLLLLPHFPSSSSWAHRRVLRSKKLPTHHIKQTSQQKGVRAISPFVWHRQASKCSTKLPKDVYFTCLRAPRNSIVLCPAVETHMHPELCSCELPLVIYPQAFLPCFLHRAWLFFFFFNF